jgi:hypothetical protein
LKRIAFICLVCSLCCVPQIFADPIIIGDLEYNLLSTGVNYFTVNNFTGTNNLLVFPVASNVDFLASVLTLTEVGGGTLLYDLGDLGPGANISPSFSSALSFTQAAFSATFSADNFPLTNGDTGTFVADPSFSFTLLPSSGTTLVAGIDLGVMSASPASSASPEPGTFALWLTALAAVLGLYSLVPFRRQAKLGVS